mgnify:CR=1 FL=1
METTPSASTLSDRLRALVEMSGLAPATFSLAAKLSKSHVGQVLRGTIKTLREDAVVKICDLTGASRAWLSWGEGMPPAAESVREMVQKAQQSKAA